MVADPARSRMLCRLLAGDAATAGELARAASVTPATASGHLAQLEANGLVAVEPRGRHRYFRLANAEVAHALEALALIAERGDQERAWTHPSRAALREARCCYGHLAGRLGVRLFDSLLARGHLRAGIDGLVLTDAGRAWCASLGLEVTAQAAKRRHAYACMDWFERRDHLAGALADALLAHFLARGWLRRGEGRALAITPEGVRQLLPQLVAAPG